MDPSEVQRWLGLARAEAERTRRRAEPRPPGAQAAQAPQARPPAPRTPRLAAPPRPATPGARPGPWTGPAWPATSPAWASPLPPPLPAPLPAPLRPVSGEASARAAFSSALSRDEARLRSADLDGAMASLIEAVDSARTHAASVDDIASKLLPVLSALLSGADPHRPGPPAEGSRFYGTATPPAAPGAAYQMELTFVDPDEALTGSGSLGGPGGLP